MNEKDELIEPPEPPELLNFWETGLVVETLRAQAHTLDREGSASNKNRAEALREIAHRLYENAMLVEQRESIS